MEGPDENTCLESYRIDDYNRLELVCHAINHILFLHQITSRGNFGCHNQRHGLRQQYQRGVSAERRGTRLFALVNGKPKLHITNKNVLAGRTGERYTKFENLLSVRQVLILSKFWKGLFLI